MANNKYTKELLEIAINKSHTWSDVCRLLNIKVTGGGHAHIQKRAKDFEIDYSHFVGKSWWKGKEASNKIKLEDLLVQGVTTNTSHLRKRLIEAGLKLKQCEWCGLGEWRGQVIPLELDHINGDKKDNRIENLRILCPNCHAQTPTYRRKKIKTAG